MFWSPRLVTKRFCLVALEDDENVFDVNDEKNLTIFVTRMMMKILQLRLNNDINEKNFVIFVD